jgi:hypothetical protein
MKVDFSPRLLALILVAALGIVFLGGWYGLVSPEQSKATKLESDIADAQTQLKTAKLLVRSHSRGKGQVTGVAALTTAMPSDLQMPALLVQVQRNAALSNVSLDSFVPAAATPLSGYNAVPIDVRISGRYAAIQQFLHRLRVQAGTTGGRIRATGRLFDVQSVGMTPTASGAAQLVATIRLAAFVYSGVTQPTTPQASATTTTTSSGEVTP